MRVVRKLSRLGIAVALLAAVPAGAQITTYAAVLNGANENPPSGSTGTGVFSASYNAATHLLTLTETFSGLIGNTTISHIHCCTLPPNNVGVSTPLPSFPGFPAGVKAGTYTNSFDLSLAGSFNPAFVAAAGGLDAARNALLAGMTNGTAYINIHSTRNPGGEIRGFITATPEPSTYALMATGLGAVGMIGWRKRRSV
jgi:hypothetical protein